MKDLATFFPMFAAQKVSSRHRQVHRAQPVAPGPVPAVGIETPEAKHYAAVGVVSAKGGCGATTIALNLAAALAKHHGASALLDANLQNPDAAVLLGREPRHSLVDLVTRHHEMDAAMIEACSAPIFDGTSSGTCRLLSAPADGSGARATNLSRMAECLESLRSFEQYYVVDLPGHLDKHLVTMLDRLDHIFLVFDATISGVAASKRWLNIFAELEYPEAKITAVLNRSGGRFKSIEDDLPALLARSCFKLPNAFFLSQDCASSGIPAVVRAPREKFAVAVSELAMFVARLKADQLSVQLKKLNTVGD
ncbi:MAG: P-loop NTPase [Candidatus Obscuribacterales bacterium]|nr:P-loop NTPase [Candidatus Obscuribacterales bacterium]